MSIFYHQMFSFHKRWDPHIPPNSVVLIGDSNIQGLETDAVYEQSVNFGIGGDTTVGVINRISSYTSLLNAKVVVLMIGYNDIDLRKDDEIINNYKRIVELIPETVPVILCLILPVADKVYRYDKINSRVKNVNEGISKLCNYNNRLSCFDLAKDVADADGNLKKNFHLEDGMHLNANGYRLFINRLKTKIDNWH